MTSSHPTRSRTRLAGVAALAAAVVGSGLTPLLVADASAEALLAAPAVVGPTDAGPLQKEVVLDWTGVAGAASYLVQVDTDDEWSDTPTLETTTVASRLTLPVSLPHAAYVWRVAAVGPGGQGRWSDNGTFSRGWNVTTNPLAPSGRVDSGLGVPTFSWTPVETASEYQLQVSTSPYFDAPFRTQSGVTTESCFTTRTSITPFNGQANARNDGAGDCVFSLLGTGESRYWRVRPLDHVVDGAPEVNTTPVVDEGVSSQPPAKMGELDTTACPAPPGSAASPSPSAPAPSPSAPGSAAPPAAPSPSASPDATAEGGCEPANTVEKGAWSRSVEFSHVSPADPTTVKYYGDLVAPAGSTATAPPPMAAPTLSRDVCSSAALCRDFPTVSWQKVDGAQAYRLYVSLDADYSNIQAIVETPGTTWTPTDQWRDSTAGAAYYVFVQPCTTSPSSETTPRKPGCDDPSAPTSFRKSSVKLATAAPVDGALLGASTN
ncbi:MAG: hypothetical protein H7233_16230, partial [Pseudorhodobacter sp.]|nr:hypothetical protein [Frankiaceae bacterium]